MTARRVLITQERIVQVDDANELKCGERCQFMSESISARRSFCKLEGQMVGLVDRNRTEACMSGEVRS